MLSFVSLIPHLQSFNLFESLLELLLWCHILPLNRQNVSSDLRALVKTDIGVFTQD